MQRVLVSLVALPLLVLAGCNETGEGSADVDDIPTTVEVTRPEGTTTSTPSNEQTASPSIPGPVEERGRGDAADGSIEVRTHDVAFEPTYIRAVEGGRVTVSLRNDSSRPHTFTMAAQDVDQDLPPGSTAEVTVTLPREGPVVFVCRLHEAAGMKGAFHFD